MSELWETDGLLAAINGRPLGTMPEMVTGVSIDSRSLKPGEAFFAIKGDLHDGHDFVSGAMKAGAGLAVVAEEKLAAFGRYNLPLIVVTDVLEALQRLGMAARARSKAQIIAVTGSVGKTTTKEMLRRALAPSGKTHASIASYNNHWGVPLTLSRLPADARVGVFEIGMNHADEIRPLVKQVRPHVAMITNVAAVHLGAFRSIDDIGRAKAEIFEGVVPGGYGLINRDDRRYTLLADLARAAGIEHLKSFGRKRESDFRLGSVKEDRAGSSFTAAIAGERIEVRLNVPGRHLVFNALGVLAAASLVGADVKKAAAALADFSAEKGRGSRYRLKKGKATFLLIDESFNANPASMAAALATLGGGEPKGEGRRIAVLGDMLELGRNAARLHRGLAKPVTAAGVDLVLTVGDTITALAEALPAGCHIGHAGNWHEAFGKLDKVLRDGDIVMLKASKGVGFADLVQTMRDRYKAERVGEAGS